MNQNILIIIHKITESDVHRNSQRDLKPNHTNQKVVLVIFQVNSLFQS